MDLIRISDSKLKVMLTASDMEKYALDGESIDYDNTETRKAFWCILDEAKHRTGFDAASEKVFIQVYQSRNGGCEMYVTKLIGECREREGVLCRIDREEKLYYRFESLRALIGSCRCLRRQGYGGASHAYVDSENKEQYFLALSPFEPERLVSLLEFGRPAVGRLLSSYIAEHCQSLCAERAVETLAEFS